MAVYQFSGLSDGVADQNWQVAGIGDFDGDAKGITTVQPIRATASAAITRR